MQENILYIDFSPSGARYTLSGELMGEVFEFTYGGSGEHIYDMIWNALENLSTMFGLEDIDEFIFDEIYIDGFRVDIEAIIDDYSEEDL